MYSLKGKLTKLPVIDHPSWDFTYTRFTNLMYPVKPEYHDEIHALLCLLPNLTTYRWNADWAGAWHMSNTPLRAADACLSLVSFIPSEVLLIMPVPEDRPLTLPLDKWLAIRASAFDRATLAPRNVLLVHVFNYTRLMRRLAK